MKLLQQVVDIPTKYRRGRRINTRLSVIKKELEELGISWEEAQKIAQDRQTWKNNIIYKVL